MTIKLKIYLFLLSCFLFFSMITDAQIPMERILSRVTMPSEGDLRGLVDTIGFPHTAAQIEFIAKYCEKAEKQDLKANRAKYNLNDSTSFIFAISPHDDYMLAARNYVHIYPYGCDADGYKQSMQLDETLVNNYLRGPLTIANIHKLYGELIDEHNISQYKVTWCGRFSVTFSAGFAAHLTLAMENRVPVMHFLSHGSSLSNPWLPLKDRGMGITADVNLHHFVTYIAVGGR